MSKIQASRTPSNPYPPLPTAVPLPSSRDVGWHSASLGTHPSVTLPWIFCLTPPPSHIPHMHLPHPLLFPNPHPHPSFLLGLLAVVLSTYICLDCFKPLSELFTFGLTVHPTHKLITTHFCAYVRHSGTPRTCLPILPARAGLRSMRATLDGPALR